MDMILEFFDFNATYIGNMARSLQYVQGGDLRISISKRTNIFREVFADQNLLRSRKQAIKIRKIPSYQIPTDDLETFILNADGNDVKATRDIFF